MVIVEQIQQRLRQLPPVEQREVLDFVIFLQRRHSSESAPLETHSLSQHPAFGAWRARKIDALAYEQDLRISQADNEYRRYQRVLISRITWMEVLVGTQDQEEEALVRDFLDTHFEIIPLDLAVAETAIHLRRQHHMRLPDAIIWATARIHAAKLVSRNTKDFKPVMPFGLSDFLTF